MFKYLSTVKYNFGITGGTMDVANIFKNITISKDDDIKLKVTNVEKDERPDQTSYKLYSNFDYYWILLFLNGIKNPLTQWSSTISRILYLDANNTEKIKNKVRDDSSRIITIKLSEL